MLISKYLEQKLKPDVVDDTDPNDIYLGYFNGTSAKCLIKRITKTAGIVTMKYPFGRFDFAFDWANRANYSDWRFRDFPLLFANIKYGALYNWYVGVDIRKISSSEEWDIPVIGDWQSVSTNLGGNLVAGGKLKESGLYHWSIPNTGAVNSVEFGARAGGLRASDFSSLLGECRFQSKSEHYLGTNNFVAILFYLDAQFITAGLNLKTVGSSVRLVRDATESELLLPDGLISSKYTGNDLKVYPLVKIESKIWLATNLNETQFRTGEYIHGFEGGVYTPISNENWEILETAGMCYYNNNELNG